MKTTEVFVEQVLIGLLVILNLGLILSPEITSQVKKLDSPSGTAVITSVVVIASAAVIATAYLVGIVFDRCADTLLEDIERHCRLQTALQWKKAPLESDPFPEDQYRMKILQNAEAVTYANYIRTRIRLSRAMAILIPGLSVSFLLSETRGRIAQSTWIAAAVSLGVIYSGALVAQLIRGKKIEASGGSKETASNDESRTTVAGSESRTTVWYKPPRTNDRAAVNEYLERKTSQKKTLLWWFAVREPSLWGFTLLTALGLALALQADRRAFLAVPFVTIVLTLLTGWTWWRITRTFLAFLRDYSAHTT
ncbi:MAG: hypothetical protein AABN33_17180 [Acidobacteriota bacterium]